MKISIISNYTFASSLPDDLKAVHQYGSESMLATLARQLELEHEVHFYAPVGSSRIGLFHPIRRTDGKYLSSDLIEDMTLDGSKALDLLSSDFVIDATPWANNIVELVTYNDFRKYLCYRLGYQDYLHPNIDPKLQHHITHCQYFADLFEKAGHPCQVAHFGISDFWKPSGTAQFQFMPDQKYVWYFTRYGIVEPKSYYLFPHRYNKEKGSFDVIYLAREFPDKTFVFSSAAVSPDHIRSLEALRQIAPSNCKFVDIPSTPDREFYRRELYRNAICTLSPFKNINNYHDTGGILSMESIKCGTPVIVTKSLGSEEILGHQEDEGVVFVDGTQSLKMALKYIDFLSMKPAPWKWTVENYVSEYMEAIKNII